MPSIQLGRNNMNRYKLTVLACAFLVWGACESLFAQNNVVDEVIWVVGDEAILKSDVEEARLSGEKINGNPYCVIPERLAIQKLFLHQAAIDSVEVTQKDVSADVEAQLNEWVMLAGSKEKLEEYHRMSISQIRERLYDQLKDIQTMRKMQKKLTADVKVTPAEVRRYFKEMPEDSLPLIPTSVEVQIITRQPRVDQGEIDRIKEELRDYTERVTSGNTSFSTLAILYSEDPGSARQGGELDYMGKGELDPAFATVAFSMTDPKKVSKIVESEFGFHIIQLVDKRGDKVKVRHILKKPRLAQADIDSAMVQLDSIAEYIRLNKVSFEEAAAYASDDKDTRNSNGVMSYVRVNAAGDGLERASRFEMQELPPEVAKVVEKLKTGEISDPFVMINSKGQEVCAIVKLKSRIMAHKADVGEDYQRLKSIVVAKKGQELINQWIKDKQKSTYIRINEKWRDCDFEYPGWIK